MITGDFSFASKVTLRPTMDCSGVSDAADLRMDMKDGVRDTTRLKTQTLMVANNSMMNDSNDGGRRRELDHQRHVPLHFGACG